jgi:hypothetical protein
VAGGFEHVYVSQAIIGTKDFQLAVEAAIAEICEAELAEFDEQGDRLRILGRGGRIRLRSEAFTIGIGWTGICYWLACCRKDRYIQTFERNLVAGQHYFVLAFGESRRVFVSVAARLFIQRWHILNTRAVIVECAHREALREMQRAANVIAVMMADQDGIYTREPGGLRGCGDAIGVASHGVVWMRCVQTRKTYVNQQ